jgi:hypothetical protein
MSSPAFLIKLDSSGNILWSRSFTNNAFNNQTKYLGPGVTVSVPVQLYGVKAVGSGSVLVSGTLFTGFNNPNYYNNSFYAELPADGTGTGIWTIGAPTPGGVLISVTYASNTFTSTSNSSFFVGSSTTTSASLSGKIGDYTGYDTRYNWQGYFYSNSTSNFITTTHT